MIKKFQKEKFKYLKLESQELIKEELLVAKIVHQVILVVPKIHTHASCVMLDFNLMLKVIINIFNLIESSC